MPPPLSAGPQTRRTVWYYSILVTILIVFAGVIALRPKPSDNGMIRIGVLAPLSSFMSGHGHSIEAGARVAEKEINDRGGIAGRKVELVIVDTNSDPSSAAERASELVGKHAVDLVIGTGTSAETLAAIPVTSAARTPFLYSLDGECKTCNRTDHSRANPFVWGTGFTERMVVRPLFEFLSTQIHKKGSRVRVYFIGGDYVYPRTTNAYAKEVATELGLEVVGDEYSDTATQDYAPVIRRIANSGADLLIVTNPGASGVTFMRQAKQMQLDKSVVISGFATFDQEALDAMGDSSEGVYCINRYSRLIDTQENREFITRYRAMYPDDATLPGPTAAAGAYGAIMVAKAAYEQAGSFDVDAFSRAMDNLTVRLPQGVVRVNPTNHVFDQPIYVMQIKKREYEIVATFERTTHPGFEGCSVR